MGTRLVQLALIVVFGLIVIFATLIGFQAWHNNAAPTEAEIQSLANRATKMDMDVELAELTGRYETGQNIDMAGRVILIVESIVLAFLVIYGIFRAVPEERMVEEGTLRRAYEGR